MTFLRNSLCGLAVDSADRSVAGCARKWSADCSVLPAGSAETWQAPRHVLMHRNVVRSATSASSCIICIIASAGRSHRTLGNVGRDGQGTAGTRHACVRLESQQRGRWEDGGSKSSAVAESMAPATGRWTRPKNCQPPPNLRTAERLRRTMGRGCAETAETGMADRRPLNATRSGYPGLVQWVWIRRRRHGVHGAGDPRLECVVGEYRGSLSAVGAGRMSDYGVLLEWAWSMLSQRSC